MKRTRYVQVIGWALMLNVAAVALGWWSVSQEHLRERVQQRLQSRLDNREAALQKLASNPEAFPEDSKVFVLDYDLAGELVRWNTHQFAPDSSLRRALLGRPLQLIVEQGHYLFGRGVRTPLGERYLFIPLYREAQPPTDLRRFGLINRVLEEQPQLELGGINLSPGAQSLVLATRNGQHLGFEINLQQQLPEGLLGPMILLFVLGGLLVLGAAWQKAQLEQYSLWAPFLFSSVWLALVGFALVDSLPEALGTLGPAAKLLLAFLAVTGVHLVRLPIRLAGNNARALWMAGFQIGVGGILVWAASGFYVVEARHLAIEWARGNYLGPSVVAGLLLAFGGVFGISAGVTRLLAAIPGRPIVVGVVRLAAGGALGLALAFWVGVWPGVLVAFSTLLAQPGGYATRVSGRDLVVRALLAVAVALWFGRAMGLEAADATRTLKVFYTLALLAFDLLLEIWGRSLVPRPGVRLEGNVRGQATVGLMLLNLLPLTALYVVNDQVVQQEFKQALQQRIQNQLGNIQLQMEQEEAVLFELVNGPGNNPMGANPGPSNFFCDYLRYVRQLANAELVFYTASGVQYATTFTADCQPEGVQRYLPPHLFAQLAEAPGSAIFDESPARWRAASTILYQRTPVAYLVAWFDAGQLAAGFDTALSYFVLVFIVMLLVLQVFTARIAERSRGLIDELLGALQLLEKNQARALVPRREASGLLQRYNQLLIRLRTNAKQRDNLEATDFYRNIARKIAHEIRNPLTPIALKVQQTQMLLQRGETDRAAENLRVVHQHTQRLASLTEKLVQQGQPEDSVAQTDLPALLEELLQVYSDIGVGLRLLPPKIAVPAVRVPTHELRQILENLIRNAAQAGATQLLLDWRFEEKNVVLRVTDNAQGMPREIRNRVFNRYFTTKKQGLGFGLYEVRRIVEQRGGAIWLTSLPKVGTSFTLKLPIG